MPRIIRILALWALTWSAAGVSALEFRSVAAPGAVLYDAPSQRAKRLFILTAGYPVEIVVSVEGWHKVRDAQGALAWIERGQLSDERSVMVNAPRAAVRSAASEDAPVLFEADQGLVLKVLGSVPGWLHVEHRDGTSGFLRSAQAWGE